MAANWESHFSKGTTAARPAANTLPQGAIYWSTDDHKFFVGSGAGNTWADFTVALLTTIAAGSITTTELGGDITTAGKALLDDADAAAQRTTLGLGDVAMLAKDTDGTLAANSDSRVATQKATKTYVDATLAGLSWKQSVRCKTTANVSLSGGGLADGTTHDGVTVATGDRVLVASQTTGAENGIYIVPASGAASRSADADSGAELVNASVFIQEGTTYADTEWVCTTNAPISLGSTSVAFTQFTAGGSGIPLATVDAKGDLIVGTADNTVARLAVGADGKILIADSAQSAGVKWDWGFSRSDAGNSSTAITVDFANGPTQKITLTDNATFTLSNPQAGGVYVLELLQDGTGSRTVTWPSSVKWPGGTAPTLTTTAGRTDVITLYYNGTNYAGTSSLNHAL